jgi:RND family efflux transporter MFP subunit
MPFPEIRHRFNGFYRSFFLLFGGLGLLAFVVVGLNGCFKHGHAGSGHDHTASSGTGASASFTYYTQKAEWFVEHAPFVQGEKGTFLAHITWLEQRYLPVKRGSLVVEFAKEQQVVRRWKAPGVLRTGIFKPQGKAPAPGKYRVRFLLKADGKEDLLWRNKVVVYSTAARARKANPEPPADANEQTFLKEQQWNIPFTTSLVSKHRLKTGIRVSGQVRSLPGQRQILRAPISGRVRSMCRCAPASHEFARGKRLLLIEPILFANSSLPGLKAEILAATSALNLAKRHWLRLKKMASARAIPSWKVVQARHQMKLAKTRLKTANSKRRLFFRSRRKGSGRTHGIYVNAPFQGRLLYRFVNNGVFVTQGQPLLEFSTLKRVRIVAHLPESYVTMASKVVSASVQATGNTSLQLAKPDFIGASLDPVSRTLPVSFFFENKQGFRLQQFVQVHLHTRQRHVLAVPAAAVVDDSGTPTVFVQVGGEAFLKKAVKTGVRDNGKVEILSGLRAGERIVTRGAYEMLLTFALKQGGGMDHGHDH